MIDRCTDSGNLSPVITSRLHQLQSLELDVPECVCVCVGGGGGGGGILVYSKAKANFERTFSFY